MSQQNFSNTLLRARSPSSSRQRSILGGGNQRLPPSERARLDAGSPTPVQTISNEPIHRPESLLKRRVLDELRVLILGESGIDEIFISPSGERFWLVGPVWTDELDLLGARVAVQIQEAVAPSRTPLILGGFVEVADPSFSSFERIPNKP